MSVEYLELAAKMAALAQTFPSVSAAPGVPLWDANTFDRWAAESPVSHGELRTAQFLLAVWDFRQPWRCGPFDLIETLRVWDAAHQAALLSINQDAKGEVPGVGRQNCVRELIEEHGGFACTLRQRYWLRQGYAEEVFVPR